MAGVATPLERVLASPISSLWAPSDTGTQTVKVVAGGVAFLIPQVPAMAAGFAIAAALAWRRQAAAVLAIEERDGVRFYVDKTSPFSPIRLIRTPGFGGDYLARGA